MINEKDPTEEKAESQVKVEKIDSNEQVNIVCSKHGIINNGAFYIRYSTIQEHEKKTAFDNHNLFCIACLNELYMKFQQDGTIGKISVTVSNTENGETKTIPLEEVEIKPKEIIE